MKAADEPKIKILKDFSEHFKDFLNQPSSLYKNIIYNKEFSGHIALKTEMYETSEKLCVSSTTFTLKKNKSSYYLKIRNKKGFTYNKKTKKVKIWFGDNVSEFYDLIKPFFNEIKIDWFDDYLFQYITKTGLEGIISGKITNPVDYCKHYLKINRIKASPKYFYGLIRNGLLSKPKLFKSNDVFINLDNYFKLLLKQHEIIKGNDDIHRHAGFLDDLIDQANTLEVKINANWSLKRILLEHSKLTKIIMDIEMENFEDEPLDYSKDFIPTLPKGINLLDSKKKIYAEGETMKHCIYTNYWNPIKNKSFLVFSINYNGERATLGCNVDQNGIKYHSISSFRNQNPSKELVNWVKLWYKEFKEHFKINGTIELKKVEALEFEPIF